MLAIRGARLFDGDSGTLTPHPLVLVEGGKVIAVTSGAPPETATLIDLGDVTLLPGLVDGHVHLVFDASADPVGRLSGLDDELVLAGMRAAARATLAAGITTVRDLGDRGYLALRIRAETEADPLAGPHVLASGPPITVTRGHCWYLGGEADGVEGIRAAVREHHERGVDVIKVMATGGELTPGTYSHQTSYTVEELRAAAQEAHRLGLPITAHAHSGAGIANAARAGFDMVEHCSFLTADGARVDEAVIETIRRSGMIVSATLGTVPGTPAPRRIDAVLPQLVAVFRRLREAGLTIVCSSDAGIAVQKPHGLLGYTATMMVQTNGYPTIEVLRAITSAAASANGLGDRKGRLAPGFDADILAVYGNPLADIGALHQIAAVFRLGHRAR